MGFKVSLLGLHTDMLIVICLYCIVLYCITVFALIYAPSYGVFMFGFLGSLIRYLVVVFLKWDVPFARSSCDSVLVFYLYRV